MKKTYVMYKAWSKMFLQLEPEKAGLLIQAICAYQDGQDFDIGDPVLEAVFAMFVETFDKDTASYEERCARYQSQAIASDRKRSTYEYDNDNDYDNDLNNKEGKKRRFTPPSLQEVKEYCIERKNDVCPENFVNFYTAKDWMVGKNKMRDWKAAVRTWEQRGKTEKNAFNRMTNNAYDFDAIEAVLNG